MTVVSRERRRHACFRLVACCRQDSHRWAGSSECIADATLLRPIDIPSVVVRECTVDDSDGQLIDGAILVVQEKVALRKCSPLSHIAIFCVVAGNLFNTGSQILAHKLGG